MPYEGVLQPLKSWQCDQSRFRILAGFAKGALPKPAPVLLEPLIAKWWEWPRIPFPQLPQVEDLSPDFSWVRGIKIDLPKPPHPPKWVIQAEEEAEHLLMGVHRQQTLAAERATVH